jgi:S1-C subfamily serine protease
MKANIIAILLAVLVIVGCSALQYNEREVIEDLMKHSTVRLEMMNDQGMPTGVGSGFIWSDEYIATAGHCVKDSRGRNLKHVTVILDGRRFRAEVVGGVQNGTYDTGVIKIPEEMKKYVVPVPRDFSPLFVLDNIVIIGCGMGLPNHAVKGVISNPELRGYGVYRTQSDASANPGNSGGAMLRSGKLVGMLVAGYPHAENINFSVPTSEIKKIVDLILKEKKIRDKTALDALMKGI